MEHQDYLVRLARAEKRARRAARLMASLVLAGAVVFSLLVAFGVIAGPRPTDGAYLTGPALACVAIAVLHFTWEIRPRRATRGNR